MNMSIRNVFLATAIVTMFAAAGQSFAAPAPTGEGVAEKSRVDLVPKPSAWVAVDQEKAVLLAQEVRPLVKDVLREDLPLRQQRLRLQKIGLKEIKHSYLLLESSFVATYPRQYAPVRFMHSKHAAALQGDCATCHHYRPADPAADEIVGCRSCHQQTVTEKDTERIGLKAAYHTQCMGCHERMKKGPVSCEGCHAKRGVEHKDLVRLSPNPTPQEVTTECLRCHQDAGKDMLKTAHWLWRGPSPFTVEHRKSVMSGKGTTTLNNF